MTWVVGGNCFNGFVCVSDIQVTIEFNGRPNKYFNCLQKVHKIHDNLCVAFSGDIKTALIIVEGLQVNIKERFKENEMFDIEGQSHIIKNYLQEMYKKINGESQPFVDFMFLWNSQREDDLHFTPSLVTFRSPNFNMTSTPVLNARETGYGRTDEQYNAIATLLSGKSKDTTEFNKLKGELVEIPRIWTVEKFKNFVFAEASKVNFPGVSKTLVCCESVIQYQSIFPSWVHDMLKVVFQQLGVKYQGINTANDLITQVELDKSVMDDIFKKMKQYEPDKLDFIRELLGTAMKHYDGSALTEVPKIEFSCSVDDNEKIDSETLFSKWEEVEGFLKQKGIKISACSAIAA